MINPSIETLQSMNAEDWSQRYRGTYIKYDEKCWYVSGIKGPGILNLSDGEVAKKAPAPPPPDPPQEVVMPARVRPLVIKTGLSLQEYILTVMKNRYRNTWIYTAIGDRNFNRLFTDIHNHLSEQNKMLPWVITLFNRRDFVDFKDLIIEYGGNHIDVDGFRAGGNTAREKQERMATCCNIMYQRFLDADERIYRTIMTSYEEYLGLGNIDARNVAIDLNNHLSFLEIVQPDNNRVRAINFDLDDTPEDSGLAVKINVKKLVLERPKSRWFVSGKDPYFIGYTNDRQYKRGLCPTVAKVFGRFVKGEVDTIPLATRKEGCQIYGDSYDYKDNLVIRRTMQQINDEVKEKSFILLKPNFLINKSDIFYKNVNIGKLIKEEIALRNAAFSQEIEELIYYPKISIYYGKE